MSMIQGVGGVFLYADNVDALASWYTEMFGIEFHNWGSTRGVKWPSADIAPAGRQASTVFALFQSETPLPPGRPPKCVNLRVSDLKALVEKLRAADLEVEDGGPSDYGHFAWVHDPEGNRLELWEPALV